jgi:hypothetical protein
MTQFLYLTNTWSEPWNEKKNEWYRNNIGRDTSHGFSQSWKPSISQIQEALQTPSSTTTRKAYNDTW